MTRAVTDIVSFTEDPMEISTYRPPADKILAGDPVQIIRNFYTDQSGRFSAGIWEGQPGIVQVVYTEDEFCHLLDGEVVITDAAGTSRRFVAGEAFVIPSGFVGTWETVMPVRKYYAILEAAQQ